MTTLTQSTTTRKPLILLLLFILGSILSTACGEGSAESRIEVSQAVVNIGAQGDDSPVYLALRNHDSKTDLLTGASTDAAEEVLLHNSTEVVELIPVDADTEFVFVPDGFHIMLVSLNQELRVGDEIEIVLHFRDHPDITINVPVQETADHGHGEN